MSDALASAFMELFAGYTDAYGTYRADADSSIKTGKIEQKSTTRTLREPVTLALWVSHLSGERTIGIIPIRADNTCTWGVIDVDKYDLNHSELVEKIKKSSLPLVVCRSKSGGAHLFMFLSHPTPAGDVIAKLRSFSARLGLGNCEIFPKQTHVLLDRGDLGSWLNMPYFGGERTTRYGVKAGGLAMSPSEFITVARGAMVESLDDVRTVSPEANGLADGPPCLEHLTSEGFPEGTRNNGLFALGVFCKKKYGDQWENMLEECNFKYMKPPLGSEEVSIIKKSLRKKEYNYKCKDIPICNHCNSALCRTRKYGVTGSDEYPVISGLSILDTEPPLWFLDIDGERLEITTEDLQMYKRFHKICLEKLVKCFAMLKQDTWFGMLSESMKTVTRIDAPPEVGVTGQFIELLEDFCMNRHRGKTVEDLLSGKPWEDEELGRHYFRLRSLRTFLEQQGLTELSPSQITTRIRQLGGSSDFKNIKGKGINVWWVPSTFVPVAKMDIPPKPEEPV